MGIVWYNNILAVRGGFSLADGSSVVALVLIEINYASDWRKHLIHQVKTNDSILLPPTVHFGYKVALKREEGKNLCWALRVDLNSNTKTHTMTHWSLSLVYD